MQIVSDPMEAICIKCQILFSRKSKTHIILYSDEFTQIVVKVKLRKKNVM